MNVYNDINLRIVTFNLRMYIRARLSYDFAFYSVGRYGRSPMTSGKEECAGILARLAELIQACEEPEAKKTLVQVQTRLQDAIANASDAEAEAIIRIFQKLLDKGSDLSG